MVIMRQDLPDPLGPTGKTFVKEFDQLSNDAKFAMDLAVMELILADLDAHREEIEAAARKIDEEQIKKVYRAAAKTILSKHQKGQHDQKEHGNWAKQVASFVGEALGRDQGPTQMALFGPDTPVGPQEGTNKILEGIGTIPERVNTRTSRMADGMREFLSGSTFGEMILNGAEFLARGSNAITEVAKMLVTYGPFAARRMIANYFRYGGYDVPLNEPGTAGGPPRQGRNESDEDYKETVRNWAINRLKKDLPDDATMDISNGEAPSEGFIIGSDGELLSHAVGRGRDYYLPFGLGHLNMLRKDEGGEMVRRRALGGITTEDLHAAMMLGADKVTVVSNSGIFTMDLTERAKGLRTEHIQILNRYRDLMNSHARGQRNDLWNFGAYHTAMKALALEFPLHFDSPRNTAGQNPGRGDLSRPRVTLMDELRELFGGKPRGPRSGTDDNVNAQGQRVQTPWSQSGITRDAWEKKQRDAGRPWRIKEVYERLGWEEPKTTPDNTRGQATMFGPGGVRITRDQQTGQSQQSGRSGSDPDRERESTPRRVVSVDEAFGTPKRDNPVEVTQTRPNMTEKERNQIVARQRKTQQEAQARLAQQRDPDLEDTVADYSTSSDQAYQMLESRGVQPDRDVSFDETERLLDMMDLSESTGWVYGDND